MTPKMQFTEFNNQLIELQNINDLDISVTFFSEETAPAELKLKIAYYDETKQIASYRIFVDNIFEYKLVNSVSEEVILTSDHPLLWDTKYHEGELYISEKVAKPEVVLVDLLNVHYSIFRGFKNFDDHFNNGLGVLEVLKFGAGLIAHTNQRLLDCYIGVLQNNNVRFSVLKLGAPSYWNGREFVPTSAKEQVLVIGESYFIGEGFHFQRE